jgi:hypothetical protein
MDANEIDRVLRDDPGLAPSPGFAGRVMVSVRQAAEQREGLPFPWRRLASAIAASALVTVGGLAAGPRPDLAALSRAAVDYGLAASAPWLAAALVLAFLPAWWSLRLAGQRG